MDFALAPGLGADCTSAQPARDYNKPIHFHLDAEGRVRAFLGRNGDCNDVRKASALQDLQRPRSM